MHTTALMQRAAQAIAALEVLGEQPRHYRRGLRFTDNPAVAPWEGAAAAIGQQFFRDVWRDAQRGDGLARGYIRAFLGETACAAADNRPVTDARVEQFVATIDWRLALSIKAIPGC